MFRKKDISIRFYSSIEGLEKNKDIIPYPAKKYIPSWWTSIPNKTDDVKKPWPTIKRCPAVPDFFTQGYILPMWGDLNIDGLTRCNCGKCENDVYVKNTLVINGKREFGLTAHPDQMFLNHYNPNDKDIQYVIKFDSPWNLITPKGWSTLILPLFYEFNKNFTILPGVVDTDIFHQMNHPALLHSDKPFKINCGDPLLMYVPFKRTKTNFEIISKNIKTDNYINNVINNWSNKQTSPFGFGFSNAYRKMQKERD